MKLLLILLLASILIIGGCSKELSKEDTALENYKKVCKDESLYKKSCDNLKLCLYAMTSPDIIVCGILSCPVSNVDIDETLEIMQLRGCKLE